MDKKVQYYKSYIFAAHFYQNFVQTSNTQQFYLQSKPWYWAKVVRPNINKFMKICSFEGSE